jgi:hypothetical protein
MDPSSSVAVGVVASILVEISKRTPWIPLWKGHVKEIRLVVATLCVLLNVLIVYLTGGTYDWTILIQSFISYVSSAATYDHLFSDAPATVSVVQTGV